MAKKKTRIGKKIAKRNAHVLKKKNSSPQKKYARILKKEKSSPPKKTRRAAPKKAKRALPSFSELKKETFELGIEQPSQHFSQARMAPEEEILELPDLPKPEALRAIEHKKRIPHAITAVLAGAVLALFSGFVFLTVLSAGELLTVSVSAAIFVGFTIFIYNKLEVG